MKSSRPIPWMLVIDCFCTILLVGFLITTLGWTIHSELSIVIRWVLMVSVFVYLVYMVAGYMIPFLKSKDVKEGIEKGSLGFIDGGSKKLFAILVVSVFIYFGIHPAAFESALKIFRF